MQQIADWLSQLGMPEYTKRFAENKTSVLMLPHLTDQDVKDVCLPLPSGKDAGRNRQARPRLVRRQLHCDSAPRVVNYAILHCLFGYHTHVDAGGERRQVR